MKLYGFFRSSAAFRVRIALNLKGLAYDSVSIHLRRNDQAKPDYQRVNPQGLVPALEMDGQTLIQSLAIIEYLDEVHPDPPLLPQTPGERARVRALADIVACDIHPINNLRVLRYLTHLFGRSESDIAVWYNHWIDAGFQALEALLARDAHTGIFCHGDRPGLADIALVRRSSTPNATVST
jgi:maleylacetoacetate isomerase